MELDKELLDVLNDPMFDDITDDKQLFEIPADMRKVIEAKRIQPDHYAQRRVCENFAEYDALFKRVHTELSEGRRSLMKITKTESLEAGRYYFVDGQMLLLERVGEMSRAANKMMDARTRCIYENGTESDILLQTLRKNVMTNGYAVTELADTADGFFQTDDICEEDMVSGYLYVLKSLSDNPVIAAEKNLYKIGFTTGTVEERIANAEHEPTYLMAPVMIVETFKIVNMNSHKFEALVHQVFEAVNYHVQITDSNGELHTPTEWYVAPLEIIELVVEKIMDGTIVNYTYNAEQQCLEKRVTKKVSHFDTSGMKVLTLNIKKGFFDMIISGEKDVECRELKQTTLNKYTYIDEADGKRYLRRYDALHLYVGYHKDCEHALVEVKDIHYNKEEHDVIYDLGLVLEHIH